MRIFLSWSGELSKKIAEKLNKWLPYIIQSIEIFYSAEDIEKGEQWNEKLSSELDESDFGIVCLTSENINSPWIHFEAGALSRKLGSKVATVMFDADSCCIQGPLSRFQSTKFEEEDFYRLIATINKNIKNPLEKDILKTVFEKMWNEIYEEINELIDKYGNKVISLKNDNYRYEEIIDNLKLDLLKKDNEIEKLKQQLNTKEKEIKIESFNNSFRNEQYMKKWHERKEFFVFYASAQHPKYKTIWHNMSYGNYTSDYFSTELSKAAVDELLRYKEKGILKYIDVLGVYFKDNKTKTSCRIKLLDFTKQENLVKLSFEIIEDTTIKSYLIMNELGDKFSYRTNHPQLILKVERDINEVLNKCSNSEVAVTKYSNC